jgi:prepilin-type N-terminal cleavage/methylation domain-containing protein
VQDCCVPVKKQSGESVFQALRIVFTAPYFLRKENQMNNNRGFGIVEVMVALGVFAIGIMAIMAMHLWTVNLNTDSNLISIATRAATDKIETLRTQKVSNLVEGEHNEKDGLVMVRYTITKDIANPRISRVDVNATLRGKTIRMESYLK